MRINRPNTLIEDHSYPLAGMREDDICRYFSDIVSPHSYLIDQIQGALLLHNIPLFCLILFCSALFFYSFAVVRDTGFPVAFYVFGVYPLGNLILKLGGLNVLRSLCITLPNLPHSAPDRVRTIPELVELLWRPVLYVWRVGFFVYRTFLCPNVVDITIFLIALTLAGLFYCVLNVLVIATGCWAIFLIFPAVFTRPYVYEPLVKHLGRPVTDDGEGIKTD
jgi:hypothetical protein